MNAFDTFYEFWYIVVVFHSFQTPQQPFNCHSYLQHPRFLSDWPLLRSAVFYVGMGLWGSVRVKTLKRTPQSVLPAFHRALRTKNLELAFEVALTIQRLVRKYGHELQVGFFQLDPQVGIGKTDI